jgi:hypothetical protein
LHLACFRGLVAVVDKLLDENNSINLDNKTAVDVNAVGGGDMTICTQLHNTCLKGHVLVTRRLLQHPKIQVKAREHSGNQQTPLLVAFGVFDMQETKGTVKELLNHLHIDVLAAEKDVE